MKICLCSKLNSQFNHTLFAFTTHKTQGQTMDDVLICMVGLVFQHGQLHVTLSFGKRDENVKVFVKATKSTKSVVIKNILPNKL